MVRKLKNNFLFYKIRLRLLSKKGSEDFNKVIKKGCTFGFNYFNQFSLQFYN